LTQQSQTAVERREPRPVAKPKLHPSPTEAWAIIAPQLARPRGKRK
jgi:hypothetical protein